MFWKQSQKQDAFSINFIEATEVVSQVGGIYANLSDQHLLVKPRSSLPRSWFAVRECFMIAYEAEHLQLSENTKNAYHYVYPGLAFFVDDDLYSKFNASLDIAARCRSQRIRKMGLSEEVALSKSIIASESVIIQDRKDIEEHLNQEDTCPKHDLLLLTETLSYCATLHRAMSNEWSAFLKLIAYRQKKVD